jgi:hypothetical protein
MPRADITLPLYPWLMQLLSLDEDTTTQNSFTSYITQCFSKRRAIIQLIGKKLPVQKKVIANGGKVMDSILSLMDLKPYCRPSGLCSKLN